MADQTPQQQTFETDEQFKERCDHYAEFQKWLQMFNSPPLVAERGGLVLTPCGWRRKEWS